MDKVQNLSPVNMALIEKKTINQSQKTQQNVNTNMPVDTVEINKENKTTNDNKKIKIAAGLGALAAVAITAVAVIKGRKKINLETDISKLTQKGKELFDENGKKFTGTAVEQKTADGNLITILKTKYKKGVKIGETIDTRFEDFRKLSPEKQAEIINKAHEEAIAENNKRYSKNKSVHEMVEKGKNALNNAAKVVKAKGQEVLESESVQEAAIKAQEVLNKAAEKGKEIAKNAREKAQELANSESAQKTIAKAQEGINKAKAKTQEVLESESLHEMAEKGKKTLNNITETVKVKAEEVASSKSVQEAAAKVQEGINKAKAKTQEVLESESLHEMVEKAKEFLNRFKKEK